VCFAVERPPVTDFGTISQDSEIIPSSGGRSRPPGSAPRPKRRSSGGGGSSRNRGSSKKPRMDEPAVPPQPVVWYSVYVWCQSECALCLRAGLEQSTLDMKILMHVFLYTLQSQYSIPWVSVAGLKMMMLMDWRPFLSRNQCFGSNHQCFETVGCMTGSAVDIQKPYSYPYVLFILFWGTQPSEKGQLQGWVYKQEMAGRIEVYLQIMVCYS